MEESKKTHKGFKLFLLIFILIGFIFIKEENQQKFIDMFDSIKLNGEKTITFNEKFEAEKEERLTYFNGSIVKWEEDKISFLNTKGENIWTKEYNFPYPEILIFEKNIYLIDKENGDIYILDNKGNTISKIQLNLPIFNLIEINNNILVHVKNDEIEKLMILDKEGKELTINQTNNILTYTCDNNSKYIITSLEIGDTINSTLSMYNFENEELYNNFFKDEVIIFTSFINNKVLVLTDKSLNLMGDKGILWTSKYPLIKDILINKDKVYLLYGDNLEIINLNGEIENKITYGLDYKRIIPLGKYICLYGNRDILILYNGEEIFNYKADYEIVDIKGNDNLLAIHYEDNIELYDIINKE